MRNPFVTNEWNPLALSLGYLAFNCSPGEYFTIQIYSERFGGKASTSPYFVICIQENGQMEAEISGNAHVSPNLTHEEYALMELLGWDKPTKAKDESFGDFPNFRKVYEMDSIRDFNVEDIIAALILVFKVEITDEFGVGSAKLADDLDLGGHLERKAAESWNPDRKIFQIPRKNNQ